MAKAVSREFGSVPDWARRGPIDPRNFSYRAEAHCAERSQARGGQHPIIERGTPEFKLWLEYFDQHLGGRPLAMRMLIDGSIKSMVVPEAAPQWFDPSFVPSGRPYFAPTEASKGCVVGNTQRANVLVRKDHERYAEMCERAKYADRVEFEFNADGILVAEHWVNLAARPSGSLRRLVETLAAKTRA